MTTMTPELIAAAKARADAFVIAYCKHGISRLLQHQTYSPTLLCQSLNSTHDMFSIEERKFVVEMADRFERVGVGMTYFSLLPALQRPFEALKLGKYQLRTGWQRVGIPINYNQTVEDHHRCGTMLAAWLFPEDKAVARHFAYHDSPESPVGDFTRYDKISRGDKYRIEELGMRMITLESVRKGTILAHDMRDAFVVYDGQATENENVRSKMRDCDLLEMAVEMLFLMDVILPEKQATMIEGFQDFWNDIGKGLMHAKPKKFFDVLQSSRHGLRVPAKDLWQAASAQVISDAPKNLSYEELAGHKRILRGRWSPLLQM